MYLVLLCEVLDSIVSGDQVRVCTALTIQSFERFNALEFSKYIIFIRITLSITRLCFSFLDTIFHFLIRFFILVVRIKLSLFVFKVLKRFLRLRANLALWRVELLDSLRQQNLSMIFLLSEFAEIPNRAIS